MSDRRLLVMFASLSLMAPMLLGIFAVMLLVIFGLA